MDINEIKVKMIDAANCVHAQVDEEYLQKIANFRYRFNVPMNKCPCEQESDERGCVGKKCLAEMTSGKPDKDGKKWCKCHCFYKKD